MYVKPTLTVLGTFGKLTMNGNNGGNNGGVNGGGNAFGKQATSADGLGQIDGGAGGS